MEELSRENVLDLGDQAQPSGTPRYKRKWPNIAYVLLKDLDYDETTVGPAEGYVPAKNAEKSDGK